MLRAKQAVKHLFDHNGVEFNKFGKGLNNLVLEKPWAVCIRNWLKVMFRKSGMALETSGTFSRPLMTGIRKRTSGTRLW